MWRPFLRDRMMTFPKDILHLLDVFPISHWSKLKFLLGVSCFFHVRWWDPVTSYFWDVLNRNRINIILSFEITLNSYWVICCWHPINIHQLPMLVTCPGLKPGKAKSAFFFNGISQLAMFDDTGGSNRLLNMFDIFPIVSPIFPMCSQHVPTFDPRVNSPRVPHGFRNPRTSP